MTINIFLAIFASVLLLTGVIGCMTVDSDEEEINFIGIIFVLCSILIFIIAFNIPSNYELLIYYWFIFIFPLVYIIMLIWKFFTKKYVLPWKRDYYREYRNLRKDFDALQDDYNKLQRNFLELENTYQEELPKILSEQSKKINKNNPKLYF